MPTVSRESSGKIQTRFTYTNGPMYYVGQQIVRQMQQSGYPCKIHCWIRSPQEQARLKAIKATKAPPWDSPHQYALAVDIIHATRGWPPKDDPFWKALYVASQIVAEKLKIELEYGYNWGWDSAHIELKHFRSYRSEYKPQILALEHDKEEVQQNMRHQFVLDRLNHMFECELPLVWKQYKKRRRT